MAIHVRKVTIYLLDSKYDYKIRTFVTQIFYFHLSTQTFALISNSYDFDSRLLMNRSIFITHKLWWKGNHCWRN